MKRYIKISAKTVRHEEVLRHLGYEVKPVTLAVTEKQVTSQVPHLEIEATEVLASIDLSTPKLAYAALKAMVAKKQVLSYTTSAKLVDGTTVELNGPYVSNVAAIKVEGIEEAVDLTPLVTKGAKVARPSRSASLIMLSSINL